MNFKYKTTFHSKAVVKPATKVEKESFASFCEASHNLQALKPLLPERALAENNPDLLFTVFPLAVVNQVNLNHDAIETETAIALARNAKFKQINIEHNREAGAIGVITGAYFSSYEDNTILSEDEVRGMKEPFNLVVTAAIWRVMTDVDGIIEECSRADNDNYMEICASWELGFSESYIAKNSKNLAQAEIINDQTSVASLEPFLRCNGGDGFDQSGAELYRVIKGGTLLGAGLTTNPAANVKGILAMDLTEGEVEDPIAPIVEENEQLRNVIREVLEVILADRFPAQVAATVETAEVKPELEVLETAASENNFKNNQNNISHSKNLTVINTKPMKFNDLKEVFAHLTANESEAFASKEVQDFISSKIAEADAIYLQTKAAKEEAETQAAQAIADAAELRVQFDAVAAELEVIKQAAIDKELQDVFTSRFTELSEAYNLEDEKLRKKIGKEIKDLDDEGYATWLENDGQVILAGREKNKGKTDVDAATEAIKEASASIDAPVPNSQDLSETKKPSLFDILSKDISIEVK